MRRVAVLGDSIAFGYWVSDEQGFARQLEELLGATVGANGDRIEVLNFGVPGYNLEQEIEALRSKALAYSPDLVIVLFCLNDLEGLFSYELGLVQERTERRRTLAGQAREWLVARSRLFSWVEYRLTELDARRYFVKAKNPLEGRVYEEAVSQEGKSAQGPVRRAAGSGGVARDSRARRRRPGPRRPIRALPAPRAAPGRGGGGRVRSRSAPSTSSTASRPTSSATCASTSSTRARSVTASRLTRSATPLCARGWLCDAVPPGPSCRDYRPSEFETLRGY